MAKAFGLAVSLVALTAAVPAAAQEDSSPVTTLTVFGDSLVDAGNTRTLFPSAANPALGYFEGRFTNGYDYTDLLSIDLFGTPTTASLQGGTNFAFGGARATMTSALPDLGEQLDLYRGFLANGGSVDPTGLYVLNIGGNDIFAAANDGAPAGYESDTAFLKDAASIYAQAVQTLADLGATNFLITGFPNAAPGQIEFSQEANVYLMSELAALSLGENVTVNFFSYLDFFGRLRTDPTQFGLPADLNFTTNCRAANAVPNCSPYFSFDGVHPTAAVQRAVYDDIQRQFGFSAPVPEPSTWLMMIFGFALIGAQMRSSRRRTIRVAYDFA